MKDYVGMIFAVVWHAQGFETEDEFHVTFPSLFLIMQVYNQISHEKSILTIRNKSYHYFSVAIKQVWHP